MAVRFSLLEIEKFDRIENCLQDPKCRTVFELYLTKTKNKNLLKVFKLWIKATECVSFDDDMLDLIDEVRGFNDSPLLSHSEPYQKYNYVKSECCRLLSEHDTHKRFIQYLTQHHLQ